MRPAGEARFANVRKLMRLASEYEAREGRDLRGLLDFLAARAEGDAEAQAATAAEGHDGVRIMTVHNAKGLEFAGRRRPRPLPQPARRRRGRRCCCSGREQPPRVGLQWRRLGRASINLYDYGELMRGGARARRRGGPAALPRRRDAGAAAPDPQRRRQARAGQRRRSRARRWSSAWSTALEVDARRATRRSTVRGRREPRPGLRGELRRRRDRRPRQPPLPRARRRAARGPPAQGAASARPARARRRWSTASRRSSPAAPSPTPRSTPTRSAPTASTWNASSASPPSAWQISAPWTQSLPRSAGWRGAAEAGEASPSAREERSARGAAVHALLEWSQENGWREPTPELARRHALRRRPASSAAARPRRCSEPVRDWLALAAARADRGRGDAGPGRGADPARPRRDRAARLDRPPGRARRRAAAGRRLQDRPPRRRRPDRPRRAATRSSARSTRSPPPRRSARPRSRSPTSSSSAPPSRSCTILERGRDGRRPASTWRRRSAASPAATSRSPPSRERDLGPLPRLPGPRQLVLRPSGVQTDRPPERRAPNAMEDPVPAGESGGRPSSSSFSSFRPSPTASSSAAQ